MFSLNWLLVVLKELNKTKSAKVARSGYFKIGWGSYKLFPTKEEIRS